LTDDFELTPEPPREARPLRVSAADIERAAAILRRWRDTARRTGKPADEIEHVMRVLSALYTEAK